MKRDGSRVHRLTVLVLPLLLVPLAPAAEADTAGGAFTQLEQRIPAAPPPGATGLRMVVDPVLRRAYQLFALVDGTGIRVFDLDNLREVSYRRFDFLGEIPLAVVDEAHHRLVIPYDELDSAGYPSFAGIRVLDGRTLAESAVWPRPVSGMGAQPSLAALSYFAPQGLAGPTKLLFLFQERAILQSLYVGLVYNVVWISQWDAVTGGLDWTHRVSSCRGVYPGTHTGTAEAPHAFFRSAKEPAVLLGCMNPDGTGIAVKLFLEDGETRVREEAHPGPSSSRLVLADPGGERMIFVVRVKEESLFVFDGSRAAYVGAVGVTNRAARPDYGIDAAAGRLFADTQDNGVLLIDTRRTPPPQALAFPKFRGGAGADIVVDPEGAGRARRVLIRRGATRFYEVYEDTIPVSSDPKLSDRDGFTVGIPEKEGVTGSSFEALGHAFGVRSLVVGGVEGLLTAREQVRQAGSPCTLFDREFGAGLVPGASLAEGSASAGAIAADADPGTKTDVKEPVSRCWPNPDPFGGAYLTGVWPQYGRDVDQDRALDQTLGSDWPFEKLECSGTASDSTKHPTLEGFVAETKCDSKSLRAEAFAQARSEGGAAFTFAPGGSLVVSAAEAGSRVTLTRDPKLGAVAVTEAWARGVNLPGVASIDLIATKATAFAAGLKGTAEGDLDRVLCGVKAGSFEQQGCSQPDLAISALNAILGAKGRARLPNPDPELKKGSPGGYVASVQKDRFEELSARALNNDFSTQVPGLEIVLFNDSASAGKGRQVFQFAGVDASTTYGIFLLPTEVSFPPIPVEEFVATLEPEAPAVLGEKIEAGPSAAPGGPLFKTIVRKVKAGLVLAARSPREAALMTVVWATLGLPLYMGLRRRRLGRALEVG